MYPRSGSYSGYCSRTNYPPPEVENGFFYEQGYGQSLGSGVPQNEEGMDLAFNGNQRLMAGWEENTNGNKELSLWGIAANNELTYQTKQAAITPEYDRVATGIVFQDGTSYLISTETAQYTGTVQAGDLGVLSAIDEDGILQWEVVLPPNGLLPKDILNYQDHLYILANQYDMGGGNRGLQLFKFDLNGNQIWMRNYSGKSGQNISATELVLDQNGFTTVGNNVTFGPEIVQWDFNGSLLQFNTPLNTGYQLFGLARDAATGNLVAAGHTGSPGSQDAVVSHFGRQGTDYVYLQDYGYDDHGTDESFHDLILHSQGITAVGKVDNSDIGEGQAWDGLGVLFDAGGNVIQNQPAGGGTQDDYMNVIVKQSDEYAYVVGYNQVFTIDASGNAWQLGFRNYNSSQASTTLPRYMYVDFILNPNNISSRCATNADGFDENFLTETDAKNIVTYAKNNNFSKIFLFDVDQLFRYAPDPQNPPPPMPIGNFNTMINRLKTLITEAEKNNIHIGWVIGGDFDKIDFIKNQVREFNYSHPQNLRYGVLEHEFWNPWTVYEALDGEVNPLDRFCPMVGGVRNCSQAAQNHSQQTKNNYWNSYAEKIRDDHESLLKAIDDLKRKDCNFWKSVTYNSKTFINPSPSFDDYPWTVNSNGSGNQIFRDTTAKKIMRWTDLVLLEYYQRKDFTNGVDFDWNQTPTSDGWEGRMEDFNQFALTKPTIFAPLFSGEGHETYCSIGVNQFLGNWLITNGLGSLKKAEDIWLNGDQGLSLDGYTNYANASSHDIDDIVIGGFGWYSYTYLKDYLVSNSDALNAIPSIGNYTPFLIKPIENTPAKEKDFAALSTTSGDFAVDDFSSISFFPNPTEGIVTIESRADVEELTVFDPLGRMLFTQKGEIKTIDLSPFAPGIYLIQVKTENLHWHTKQLILKP